MYDMLHIYAEPEALLHADDACGGLRRQRGGGDVPARLRHVPGGQALGVVAMGIASKKPIKSFKSH